MIITPELLNRKKLIPLVTGPDKNYLWILSRTPVLDQAVVDKLVSRAKSLGYKTEELIYVSHENNS